MGAGKYVYYVPVEGGGPISIYFELGNWRFAF